MKTIKKFTTLQKRILLALIILLLALISCYFVFLPAKNGVNKKILAYPVADLSAESQPTSQLQLTGSITPKNTKKMMADSERGVISDAHVKVGDTVKKGQLLFTYTNLDGDFAIREAELEVINQENLINQKSIEYANTETRLGEKQTKLNNTIYKYNNGTAEEQEELLPLTETLTDEVSQLTSQLANINAEIATGQIALEKAQATLTNVTNKHANKELLSDVDGVVKKIDNQQIGKNLPANAEPVPLCEIVDNSTLFVDGTINEFQKELLTLEQVVEIIDRGDETKRWKGTITALAELGATEEASDAENPNLTKYPYKVKLATNENMPAIGRHVYVRPILPESTEITVPKEYVMTEKTGTYLWKVANNKIIKTKVDIKKTKATDSTDTSAESTEKKVADDSSVTISKGLTKEDQIAFPLAGMADGMVVGEDVTTK